MQVKHSCSKYTRGITNAQRSGTYIINEVWDKTHLFYFSNDAKVNYVFLTSRNNQAADSCKVRRKTIKTFSHITVRKLTKRQLTTVALVDSRRNPIRIVNVIIYTIVYVTSVFETIFFRLWLKVCETQKNPKQFIISLCIKNSPLSSFFLILIRGC